MKSSLGWAVAVVMLAMVVLSGAAPVPKPDQPKWEYAQLMTSAPVCTLDTPEISADGTVLKIYRKLGGTAPNESVKAYLIVQILGSQGWEISTASSGPGGSYLYIFKRPAH